MQCPYSEMCLKVVDHIIWNTLKFFKNLFSVETRVRLRHQPVRPAIRREDRCQGEGVVKAGQRGEEEDEARPEDRFQKSRRNRNYWRKASWRSTVFLTYVFVWGILKNKLQSVTTFCCLLQFYSESLLQWEHRFSKLFIYEISIIT